MSPVTIYIHNPMQKSPSLSDYQALSYTPPKWHLHTMTHLSLATCLSCSLLSQTSATQSSKTRKKKSLLTVGIPMSGAKNSSCVAKTYSTHAGDHSAAIMLHSSW